MAFKIRYRLLSGLLTLVLLRVEQHHYARSVQVAHSGVILVASENEQPKLEHVHHELEGTEPQRTLFGVGGPAPTLPQPQPPAAATISEIVPIYNEGNVVAAIIPIGLENGLRQRVSELVVVNDNSVDNTLSELQKVHHPNLRVVNLPSNIGFFGAVEAGAVASRGDIVVTAALDVLPYLIDIQPIVRAFEDPRVSVVIASRFAGGFLRKNAFALLASVLVRMAFGIAVDDIESPVTAYRGSFIREVAQLPARQNEMLPLRALQHLVATGRQSVQIPLSRCVSSEYIDRHNRLVRVGTLKWSVDRILEIVRRRRG